MLDTDVAVEGLAALAGEGPVLELGIGTGRLALPLVERGLAVSGVEASEDMVRLLRAKPGGTDIPVVVGDFAEVRVPGDFALVVLAFNTVFALPTPAAQAACFATAARHLRPGGRFVVEAWVPDLARFVDGTSVGVRYVTPERVSLDLARLDLEGQRMETVQVVLRDGAARLFPADHCVVAPVELDLMAGAAGLVLEHRWGGWDRRSFVTTSRDHVSVWRRPSD